MIVALPSCVSALRASGATKQGVAEHVVVLEAFEERLRVRRAGG